MSIDTTKRVWRTSRQTGSHLLLLLAIADFANDDDGEAFPSVDTLAEMCRMSARNVRFLLAGLKDSGELEVTTGAGPYGANLYRVMTPEGLKPTSGGMKPASGVKAASGGMKPVAAGAEAGSRDPLKPASAKPPYNHQEPSLSSPPAKPSKSKRAKPDHPLFSRFYDAYPRKVSRPDAAKAFAAIDPSPETLQAMLAAIESQGLADRCAGGDAQFVPYPATWLNKRRWEDATEPRQRQAGKRGPVLDSEELFRGCV